MLTGSTVAAGPTDVRSNLGRTSLKRRRRNEDAMREFDRLPAELRAWLADAVMPWRPRSVRRAFDRALAATGDRGRALAELDRLEARRVGKDAARVYGPEHPAAGGPRARSPSRS